MDYMLLKDWKPRFGQAATHFLKKLTRGSNVDCVRLFSEPVDFPLSITELDIYRFGLNGLVWPYQQ